jgi:hypothetical protein
VPWKVALDVDGSHVEAGDSPGFSLRFHNHNDPFYRRGNELSLGNGVAKASGVPEDSAIQIPKLDTNVRKNRYGIDARLVVRFLLA